MLGTNCSKGYRRRGRLRLNQLTPRTSVLAVLPTTGVLICNNVKNITVIVDDETYRRARMKAAERDTSVSALVARFLTELTASEPDTEQLKREERALRERIGRFRAVDRLARDDTHRHDL